MKFVFKIQLFFSLHFVKVVSWIRTSSVLAGFFRKYFTTWKRSKNYLIEISSNKLIIQKNSLILPTMENPGCQIFSTILLALHVVPRYGVLQACDVFFCRPVTFFFFFFFKACDVFFFLKACDVFFLQACDVCWRYQHLCWLAVPPPPLIVIILTADRYFPLLLLLQR